MLFAGWFSAYLVSMSSGLWTRITLPAAFIYSTVAVLAGSATVHLALTAVRRGEARPVLPWLLATLALGIAFAVLQFIGYGDLVAKGIHITPSKMIALGGEYGVDYTFYKDGEALERVEDGFYLPDDVEHARPLNAELEETKERTGPYLYILTFMHLVHLVFGLLSLMVMVRMALQGRYTRQDHVGLWAGAVYWHFLGALWVIIFLFLSLVH
jgi:cytochrome c oxidase subunit 3